MRATVEGLVAPWHVAGMPDAFARNAELTLETPPEPDGFDAEDALPIAAPRLDSRSYDSWVFGNMAGDPDAWLASTLKEWLIAYGVSHGLTDGELAKLHRAGRADLKRLTDRIEAGRREFEAARHDYRASLAVLERLWPLRYAVESGPFEDGSLFAKALAKILNDRERAQGR